VVIDVNEDIRTVMRLIGKEVSFQAEFEVLLNPFLPRIMAAPNSITQIVTNLVVNALQALETSTGTPKVSVRTDFDDEHVLLEVADNGPGIPAEMLTKVFDPFFTTKPTGKGTGLGLAITRQLVQKMKGEIFVDNQPGGGALFSVVIERGDAVYEIGATEQRIMPANGRLRVLLLDDDELILRSLTRSLSPHFECQAVAQARLALDMLSSDGDYDAVVSDVVMPEMNGLEFWTALEHTRPELALKTVFISGGITSEQLRVRVSDTGRPCLTKPVDMSELIRTIRRLGRPFEEFHR
jgi:CheY-like chemotaxis protein/anti-sigma regulatory factor (Ser/Thr protein kinase)